jgi:hypothetical protein
MQARLVCNDFVLSAKADGAAIRDSELRAPVDMHCWFVTSVLKFSIDNAARQVPNIFVEHLERHGDMVRQALGCHIRREPVPTYERPPMTTAGALIPNRLGGVGVGGRPKWGRITPALLGAEPLSWTVGR